MENYLSNCYPTKKRQERKTKPMKPKEIMQTPKAFQGLTVIVQSLVTIILSKGYQNNIYYNITLKYYNAKFSQCNLLTL